MYFLDLETAYFVPSLRIFFFGYGFLLSATVLGVAAMIPDAKMLPAIGFAGAQIILLLIFWPELRFQLPIFPYLILIAANGIFLKRIMAGPKWRYAVLSVGACVIVVSNLALPKTSG